MEKKRNIIVGQSGGPTSVINSSLAGVYKTAKERGFHKVYGMLHGVQGFLDESMRILMSTIGFLVFSTSWTLRPLFILVEMILWIPLKNCPIMQF